MGKITLGDVLIAGLLTVILVVCVVGAVVIVLYLGFGVSNSDFLTAMTVAMCSFLLVGGIVLGFRGTRAGYPILTTWAWGAAVIAVVSIIYAGASVISGSEIDADDVSWLLVGVSVLLLGLFFTVGLAGFMNSRYSGMPSQRFRGTRPGGMFTSVTILKSNQPAIYQGVRELDFDDKAPGSLYRRRQ